MADDCKVYVGNLSFRTDDKSLADHFEREVPGIQVVEGEL